MEMEKEFEQIDKSGSWAAIYQDIRHEASDFPCRVAKLPKNKNRNRYRDVSPCKYPRGWYQSCSSFAAGPFSQDSFHLGV
uniref:protein-tyrosine-phosphatase n=1 Tax=Cebus imitator TaxID=2715852 RepID=A0A2K5QVR2_CEBIM